ncbi:MAG: FtsP/CotA-like multicopper oxidase with cupredoxin domain [Planctomycetota bacterium]|jgi:FtsP/CotA-like multicopper oxidase with cupredoxin domain
MLSIDSDSKGVARFPLQRGLFVAGGLWLVTGVSFAQGSFDPPVAPDLDPDPSVVEVHLSADETTWEYLPGLETEVWAYNGSIPGPTIQATVGDTLRVVFTNNLPDQTTIHWHGVETPADQDGSHISQVVVEPGEVFTYEFPLLSAGLAWYHPHMRPYEQNERGLYGAVLVKEKPEVLRALGLDDVVEHILLFDDVLVDDLGQIVPPFPETDVTDHAVYQLNGRRGNLLLINGKVADGSLLLNVPNGVRQRWRVVNAANSTFARLDVNADLQEPLFMIGTDGGFLEKRVLRPPVKSITPPGGELSGSGHSVEALPGEGIFLVPGERMDVIFTPHGVEGDDLRVFQHDWPRGDHLVDEATDGSLIIFDDPNDGNKPLIELMQLVLVGPDPGPPYAQAPVNLVTMPPIDPADAVGILRATMGHSNPDQTTGDVTFFVQAAFVDDGNGGTMMVPQPAMVVDSFVAQDVQVGETWIWEITNLTHGDHPFHTHGFFFEVLEVELIDDLIPENHRLRTAPYRMRKDTVRVPGRPGLKGSSRTVMRAIVRFDDTGREGQVEAEGEIATVAGDDTWTSGGWLFHCHVLEHSARGMLSFIEVHNPGDPFWLLGKSLPGAFGRPSLLASGAINRGAQVNLSLSNAMPGAPVALVIGASPLLTSIAGGTLVPSVDSIHMSVAASDGSATWNLASPGLPAGIAAYAQVVVLDGTAIEGFAFSNAVEASER